MDDSLGNHDSSVNNVDVEVVKNNNGIESHKCNQCNCATSNKGQLRSHLQMHTGKNPNKYNLCEYTSYDASALRIHLSTHDKGREKSNKCNQCNYASSYTSSLRNHMKKT